MGVFLAFVILSEQRESKDLYDTSEATDEVNEILRNVRAGG